MLLANTSRMPHNPRRVGAGAPRRTKMLREKEPAISSPESPAIVALAARGRRATYRKNTILINENEVSDGIYVILSGKVRVFSMDADAREITYARLGSGEYFGEMSLDGGARSASIITEELTECSVLTYVQVRQYLAENPDFAFELLVTVIRRAREATLLARGLALDGAYVRLKAFLEREAAVQPDGARMVEEKLTQHEIAGRIGCGREMVSRIMKKLEEGGYIGERDHRIVIKRTLPRKW